MKNRIKAIIFDVGGGIYIGKQRSNHYMAELLKIDHDIWKKATGKIWERLNAGKIDEDTGLLKMAKNIGIGKNKLRKLWIKTFKVRYILNKNLLKIIRKLRRNYKTAILSNQWTIPYKIHLTKEIKSNFDVMVFSHLVGFKKPSKGIYKITLRRLKLKPKECIFIDDIKENLTPAKSLGMKTILFKDNSKLKKDFEKLGIK